MITREARCGFFAALLVLGSFVDMPTAAPADMQAYVAVADRAGNPVTNLTAADFLVQVNGREQPVLAAQKATQPLSIAFVVDTVLDEAPYVRDTMTAIVSEIQRQSPDARAGFVRAASPPVALVRVAEHAGDLTRTVGPIVDGYNLMPGIIEGANALRHDQTSRRVVFTIDNLSSRLGDEAYLGRVASSLRLAHSALWGVAVAPSAVGADIGPAERTLEDLAGTSGGSRARVNGPVALRSAASRLVRVILSEYVVTCAAPRAPASDVIRFGVRRAGLTVNSPAWAQ